MPARSDIAVGLVIAAIGAAIILASRDLHPLVGAHFGPALFPTILGVGMIIGRYKTMHARGGSVAACGLQPPIDRLFHLAGLHRIIAITETEGRETYE